jgi:hypothetical protein
MTRNACLTLFIAVCAASLGFAACGGSSGPAPLAISSPPVPSPTPPARLLYADHNGTLYQYQLPLSAGSKPLHVFTEYPGGAYAPQLAVDPKGNIAIATKTEIRIFERPIRSLDPKRAKTIVPLTPAITQIGSGGAFLTDIEYDPNFNLWLISQLGEISELAAPISSGNVAAVTIGFGDPGTKTAGYAPIQARVDVNAALYVFGENGNNHSQLFKYGFPYAKPPSALGISLLQADFVDSGQYLPTNPNPAPLLLGQYLGPLSSPPPGSPPPIPVDDLAQFAQPLNPVLGLFPEAVTKAIVGALAADAPRTVFYTLDVAVGKLDVYALPLTNDARPKISLPCLGGTANCNAKSEHLFLSP